MACGWRLHCQWCVICPHTFAQVSRADRYIVNYLVHYLGQDTIRKTTGVFQWHHLHQKNEKFQNTSEQDQ